MQQKYADIFFKDEEGSAKDLKDRDPQDISMLVDLLEDFRFMKDCKVTWSQKEKDEIASMFQIKKLKAG